MRHHAPPLVNKLIHSAVCINRFSLIAEALAADSPMALESTALTAAAFTLPVR
jgi:hypothetical protein